jgi:hypothetical protein
MNHPLSQHRRHKLLSTNYWPAEITRRTSCVLRMGQGLFAQQQLCMGPWQESSYFFPMERPTTTKGTRALITYKREMADQINTQNERTGSSKRRQPKSAVAEESSSAGCWRAVGRSCTISPVLHPPTHFGHCECLRPGSWYS